MANLNITEFVIQGHDAGGNALQCVQIDPVATQNVTVSGASAQSSAFNSATGIIRLRTDIACAVLIGTNPTALITSLQMDANTTEYFSIPRGVAIKIAVIAI